MKRHTFFSIIILQKVSNKKKIWTTFRNIHDPFWLQNNAATLGNMMILEIILCLRKKCCLLKYHHFKILFRGPYTELLKKNRAWSALFLWSIWWLLWHQSMNFRHNTFEIENLKFSPIEYFQNHFSWFRAPSSTISRRNWRGAFKLHNNRL